MEGVESRGGCPGWRDIAHRLMLLLPGAEDWLVRPRKEKPDRGHLAGVAACGSRSGGGVENGGRE